MSDTSRLVSDVCYGFINRLGSAILSVFSAACAVVSACFGFLAFGLTALSFGGMVLTCNQIPGSEDLTHTLVDVVGAFYESTINSIKGTSELLTNVIFGNDPRDVAPHAFNF